MNLNKERTLHRQTMGGSEPFFRSNIPNRPPPSAFSVYVTDMDTYDNLPSNSEEIITMRARATKQRGTISKIQNAEGEKPAAKRKKSTITSPELVTLDSEGDHGNDEDEEEEEEEEDLVVPVKKSKKAVSNLDDDESPSAGDSDTIDDLMQTADEDNETSAARSSPLSKKAARNLERKERRESLTRTLDHDHEQKSLSPIPIPVAKDKGKGKGKAAAPSDSPPLAPPAAPSAPATPPAAPTKIIESPIDDREDKRHVHEGMTGIVDSRNPPARAPAAGSITKERGVAKTRGASSSKAKLTSNAPPRSGIRPGTRASSVRLKQQKEKNELAAEPSRDKANKRGRPSAEAPTEPRKKHKGEDDGEAEAEDSGLSDAPSGFDS